ncbi:hypothetical protein AB0878_20900 [Amycolatopsis sp. NPDC047767]|uniref:hypothetical protein n=1 Tax=Amycolatopsis sp. NPDC047767 TaxID=3156765 RepID=UPI003454893D
MEPDVETLWTELATAGVAQSRAQDHLRRARPDQERLRVLQRELRGSHRGTALAYLRYVPDDALELLPEIMWLATDLGLAHESETH